MTHEPHPEHAAARLIMDKLAKAAGMPSGQALITHLTEVPADSPHLKFIGEALAASLPQAKAVSETKGEPDLRDVKVDPADVGGKLTEIVT